MTSWYQLNKNLNQSTLNQSVDQPRGFTDTLFFYKLRLCVSYLQRISYAKRDSEIIAKMKGTYSAAGRTAKRKEGDDADAQAKRKRKPATK